MDRQPYPQAEEGVEEAINKALEAERRAREAVKRCEEEAAALVNQARAKARAIQERCDRRVTKLRARCEDFVLRRVADLSEQARRVADQPVGDDVRAACLESAVTRLAARLTGGARK